MNQYTKNTHFNPNRLNIGAYYLQPYSRTEQHIKGVSDCGVDFMLNVDYDKDMLDLFAKYGIGAVVSGLIPYWFGGNGENAGQMAEKNPLEQYDEDAKSYVDHPAIWGIDAGDEMSALDFTHYGKVIDKVNKLFPKQFAYLNLYPNYAMVAQNSEEEVYGQLGTKTYAEYIKRYCECIPADYICFDFYVYSLSDRVKAPARYYENLRIVSEATRNSGRSMWIVLQVNSNRAEEWMNTNQLRFQAFSSMAFGAETLIWACYGKGWWVNQVLDEEGNKTQQYDRLKTVNAEIQRIAAEYMNYRHVATHFIGFDDYPNMDYVQQEPIDHLDTGIFFDVKSDNGSPILAGQMVSKNNDGSYALMLCGVDDYMDQNPKCYNVLFRAEDRTITSIDGNGKVPVTKLDNGYYSVPMTSNAGVLVMAR